MAILIFCSVFGLSLSAQANPDLDSVGVAAIDSMFFVHPDADTNHVVIDSSCIKPVPGRIFYSNETGLLPDPNFLSEKGITSFHTRISTPRLVQKQDFSFYLFLLIGMMLSASLYANRNWGMVFSSTFKFKDAVFHFEEQHRLNIALSLFGSLTFFCLMGWMGNEFVPSLLENSLGPLSRPFAFGAVILLLFLLKYLGLLLIGELTKLEKHFSFARKSMLFHALMLGVLCLPMVFVANFASSSILIFAEYLFIATVIFAYANWLWASARFSSRIISKYPFHFLLYLCALEILPLMLCFKLIKEGADILL